MLSVASLGCRPQTDPGLPVPVAEPSLEQQRQQALQSVDRLIEQPLSSSPPAVENSPPSAEAVQEQARVYRADLLVGSGRAEEAIQELQAALTQHPQSTLIRTKIIGIQKRLGRTEEALSAYRELAELDPQNAAEYWESCSQILARQGKFEEALTELNKAIAREPELSLEVGTFDPIDRYRARGAIYDQLGRPAEAAADRQRASEMERRIWPDR